MSSSKNAMGALILGLCMSTLLAVSSLAATTGVEAFSLVEATAGQATTVGVNNDGGITVTFGGQDGTSYFSAELIADSATSGGAFVGSYAGVGGLTLRIRTEGTVPALLTLILEGKTGRWWTWSNILASDDASLWAVNDIPIDPSDRTGWERNEKNVDLATLWSNDLQNVKSLKLTIRPSGTQPQSYTIDNMMLVAEADFTAGADALTMLQVALLDQFGVTDVNDLTDQQREQRDGLVTGMTDLDVILSLNDLNHYANSTFALTSANGGNGVTISWVALEGKTYTIYRSVDLVGGSFEPRGSVTVTADQVDGIGYASFNDETAIGVGPYFYKIIMND